MTCPDCALAAERLRCGFRAGCRGCTARAISRGPSFASSRSAGRLDSSYLADLQRAGVTHDEVKAAAQADKANP